MFLCSYNITYIQYSIQKKVENVSPHLLNIKISPTLRKCGVFKRCFTPLIYVGFFLAFDTSSEMILENCHDSVSQARGNKSDGTKDLKEKNSIAADVMNSEAEELGGRRNVAKQSGLFHNINRKWRRKQRESDIYIPRSPFRRTYTER